jgi:hypothetical protein
MSLIKSAIGLAGVATGGGWIPLAVAFGVGFAAGGSGVGWVMYQHIVAVEAQRDEFKGKIDTFKANSDAMAASYADAVSTLKVCRGVVVDQTAATEKERFARQAADQAAARADADARAARDSFEQRRSELETWAAAHPDQVGKLAPEVQRRAQGLWN